MISAPATGGVVRSGWCAQRLARWGSGPHRNREPNRREKPV